MSAPTLSLFERWSGTATKHRGEDYEALKAALVDQLLRCVCACVPVHLCASVCVLSFCPCHPSCALFIRALTVVPLMCPRMRATYVGGRGGSESVAAPFSTVHKQGKRMLA